MALKGRSVAGADVDKDGKSESLKGGKKVAAASSRSSYFWAAVGWWIVVVISIPFAFYAAIFVWGNFDIYRKISVGWALGNHDTAGLHVLNHLRAWQIHSLAAEGFLLTAPFQFSQKLRTAYPTRHRQLGYVFVSSTAVLIISAVTVLLPNTEFSTIGRTAFGIMAILISAFLFLAVKSAKERKFKVHQKFMIRIAALGYSVMMMRVLPPIIQGVTGVAMFWSFEIGAVLAPLTFGGVAEIYIQKYLN